VLATIQAEILQQHALGAGSLWLLRDLAVGDPAYDLDGVAALDERIEAHLDALRLAEEAGFAVSMEGLADAEAGEVFAAVVLAVERRDLSALAHTMDLCEGDAALARGLVSGLGWAAYEHLAAILPGFLDGRCPPSLRRMGIAACAAHRQDPGAALGYAATDRDPHLRARALRAAGELGRTDLLPELRAALGDDDGGCRFWGAWSAALLGDGVAGEALVTAAAQGGPASVRAADLAARRAGPGAVRWIRALGQASEGGRPALVAAGALGDPALVPWILERMADPASARLAGATLRMITGVDLTAAKLHRRRPPEGFQAGPSDDAADEDVDMDPDGALPWPDPDAVSAWWSHAGRELRAGTRYLLGRPMDAPAALERVLAEGHQPARAAAAIVVSARRPRRPLFEVRAPAARQRAQLA
jgi:uncharacterized protein (TIGR02270 family)